MEATKGGGLNVNIGGGNWNYPGWVNLDQQQAFPFTPSVTFPIGDKSAEIVYSSHCLEHLCDSTVDRVLSEARRICRGILVLKLPDFEEVMKRWKSGDTDYFNHWGLNGVVKTWKNKAIQDSIHARACMVFCGWWNDAYGNEWGGRNPDAPGAYHGPAMVATPSDKTPHEMAQYLKAGAPLGGHFNHQNAWSRDELITLLSRHGFDVKHMDRDRACELPIPGIKEHYGISMYAVAG